MRDKGVESPTNIFSRLIYWITRKRFKKVLLPVKLHARSPGQLLGFGVMTHLQTRRGEVEPELSLLGQARVASLVGCPF